MSQAVNFRYKSMVVHYIISRLVRGERGSIVVSRHLNQMTKRRQLQLRFRSKYRILGR